MTGRGSLCQAPELMLAMVPPRQCWSWCNVAAESCWQWYCQCDVGRDAMSLPRLPCDAVAEVTLNMARCRCRVMLMMRLPSHVGDDDADATLVATLPRTMLTWHLVLSSRRTRTDESFVHLKLPTWETLCQIKT
jgi:hypothetical protein